jgi:CDI immunity protein
MTTSRTLLKLYDDWDPLFPVQAFFNSVSDASFVATMAHISNGHGCSTDYCHCRFPSDVGPNEPSFDGVQFSLFKDAVVISYRDFADYFSQVCRDYLAQHPTDADLIVNIVTRAIETAHRLEAHL